MSETENQMMYFAAKDSKECANVLMNKARGFYQTIEANSYNSKLQKMWEAYHGIYSTSAYGDSHQVSFTGEQGELVNMPVNHFRNIAKHIHVMITSNRPIMEARAINTDYKSLAQTMLANGVLEYYMREKGLEKCLTTAAEYAIVLGSGFIKLAWNATGGDIYDYDEETGKFNYEGDLEFVNLSPYDVVVDSSKENWSHEWMLVRTFHNRYNLMAKFPELSDKLKGIPSKTDGTINRFGVFDRDGTDDIPIYEFFHKPSEALPEGRYLLFADAETVMIDTKMPYRTIPVFRISAGEVLGTPYGYSPMFDIYPIQEGINALMGTIMTNQSAFGVQNLFVPRGADIAVNTLEGGLNIIEGNAAPEPLNLTQTPAEVFKFVEMLVQTAETISGVNSVARGNPEASLKSGTALALVQSMAIQFISGLQQSYVKVIEDVGSAVISILKDYATAPKFVQLVGKHNRPYLKEFTGDSLSNINRVMVDMGNPLSRSIAGRVQMAEQMLQMQAITTPQQYFQVINTGKLEVMYEGEQSELLLIKSENERMLDGEDVMATILDQHRMHIMEHRSVLADPDLRKNPDLVNLVLNHIQEHINMLRETDPALLQLIGEQPLGPVNGTPPSPENAGQPMPPESGMAGNVPEMLSPDSGQPLPPGQAPGPGNQVPNMPKIPSPPPPFQNAPTNPAQMMPQ